MVLYWIIVSEVSHKEIRLEQANALFLQISALPSVFLCPTADTQISMQRYVACCSTGIAKQMHGLAELDKGSSSGNHLR